MSLTAHFLGEIFFQGLQDFHPGTKASRWLVYNNELRTSMIHYMRGPDGSGIVCDAVEK